ncbi:MAG: myo-inosose-2 dehydratase [Christensenellaceae bacterium]|jgi:inosose dehydratase|nr:myo-inosose-2 dehydratase [Christensenellaceae bacterium]
MLNKKNIKLGIAPIGWTNDDMPELGAENSFQQCISEIALAGFKGTEIGSKFPTKINELRRFLRVRKITIANAWFSSFILSQPFNDIDIEFRKKCRLLKAVGAKRIGVSEQTHSIQGTNFPVFGDRYIMNDEEWALLCKSLNWLGEIAQEFGLSLVYHHHMGTVIQTEEEINRLMEQTDPNSVSLLFDTGHLVYSDVDPLVILKKHINRIKHVHLKDVRPQIIEKVKEENLSFLDGVRLGTFTVPGDGTIDFVPIFQILADNEYIGWLLVEAEQDPALANPFEMALLARKYIKEKAKI